MQINSAHFLSVEMFATRESWAFNFYCKTRCKAVVHVVTLEKYVMNEIITLNAVSSEGELINRKHTFEDQSLRCSK